MLPRTSINTSINHTELRITDYFWQVLYLEISKITTRNRFYE